MFGKRVYGIVDYDGRLYLTIIDVEGRKQYDNKRADTFTPKILINILSDFGEKVSHSETKADLVHHLREILEQNGRLL